MLSGLAGLRPEERRGALAAFLTIFGILCAHTLLETSRDALFLARLPPTRLPWVYLGIAALAVLISLGPWRGKLRMAGSYSLSLLLVACAVVTFLFWTLLGSSRHPAALYAFYIWTGIEGSLAPLEFWLVLGEKYTLTQAKRIFSVVGVGSLLGAVAGAGLARALVGEASAPSLVLAAAFTFVATAIGPALLLRRPGGTSSASSLAQWAAGFKQTLEVSRRQPYIRGLGGLVLVSTVALTLADYVFKSAVAQNVPRAELGAFFANLNLALNGLGLLSQLLLSGWLFRVLGLHRALFILPALLALGATGVALGGGMVAALLLKGADGTLRYSVHRTGTELLFVPIPDGLRARAKPFIDVVGQRGGQALASLYLLSEATLHRGDAVTAAAAAALCIVWMVWTHDLRGPYLDLFRTALREGMVQARTDLPALDLGSLEALFASLNSGDDQEVLAAMDLLVEQGRARLIPALILYHPSRTVVLRALEHFARTGRTDFLAIADRLLAHLDPAVRASALRARTAVAGDEARLRQVSHDPSPLVRATALVGLVSLGRADEEERRQLDAMLDEGAPETRRAVASAVREEPSRAFVPALLRLAEAGEPEVQVLAAQAMGRIGDDRFLPALLPLVGHRDVRTAARDALIGYGQPALAFLDDALADHSLPHELRRHLPRTISLFEPVEAARVLERRLLAERDGIVRYKILRGLNRLAANPDVVFDPKVLEAGTRATLEAAFRLLDWRVSLRRGAARDSRWATPGHELLVTLLHDKEVHTAERLFRLLSLQFRGEDFKGIHRGLNSTDPKVRSGSRELLENLVRPPLRGPLVAFVDEGPDQQRLAQAVPLYLERALDYEIVLGVILEHGGESLRCLAAYHIGELRLTGYRPRLEALRPEDTGFFLARVVERALKLLSSADGGTLAHA
jgi:ATP:ADP antiporter, AAA family